MKKGKFLFLLLLLVMLPALVKAIPANPKPITIKQPDGSALTIRVIGDEYFNFRTTEDGYTVVKNSAGFYVYAKSVNGNIVPSTIVARNSVERNTSDRAFLSSVSKYLQADATAANAQRINVNAMHRQAGIAKSITSSNFKGLIILAQFTDKKFIVPNVNAVMKKTTNQVGYTEDGFTGSVRDYFRVASNGVFDPQFDVVGPVTLDYKQTDAKGSSNGRALVRDACLKAKDSVDFSKYDLNGDGYVDMIYVIFAGGGSNAGNDANYIWPHAYNLYDMKVLLNGVYCNRYACSTELFGYESQRLRDGIGTICHEFSHVLGLPDLYDTDYSGSGGQSPHPGEWDLMAGAGYLNDSRTPCSYSLYDKLSVGWCYPTVLNTSGDYTLTDLTTTNKGLRLNTPVNNEFFLLENRQRTGWDTYLPGHGMLVFRVDSTSTSVWTSNAPNNNPKHLYYEMVRADNNTTSEEGGNAFPGTKKITTLSNTTSPSLRTWAGAENDFTISNIAENNQEITFKLTSSSSYVSATENFEEMPLNDGDVTNVQGVFSKWNLTKCKVVTPDGAYKNGTKCLGLSTGATFISTEPFNHTVMSASLVAWNPTSSTASLRLYYSLDGTTWKPVYGSDASAIVSVPANGSLTASFALNSVANAYYKVSVSVPGASSNLIYIDDVILRYTPEGLASITADKADANILKAYHSGNSVIVETSDETSDIAVYTVTGMQILKQKPTSTKMVLDLPQSGMYLITQNGKTVKVMF